MNDSEARRLVDCYSDMILRICYTYLKSTADAEDICQNVFLKFVRYSLKFENEEQERAWIIRITINECKDFLKSAYKKRVFSLKEVQVEEQFIADEDRFVLDTVMKLKEKYRVSIYLFYYEGYSIKEIAELLNKSENVIAAYLSRGRKKLKNLLEYNGRTREEEKYGRTMDY